MRKLETEALLLEKGSRDRPPSRLNDDVLEEEAGSEMDFQGMKQPRNKQRNKSPCHVRVIQSEIEILLQRR
jgi:hypothetical protein